MSTYLSFLHVLAIDTKEAVRVDGVVDVLTAVDIPGTNDLQNGDEPLFVGINQIT